MRGTLRSDIEAIEGRLKYLNDRVSLSTLIAEFYEFKDSASNYGSRIGSAFAEGWRWMVATFLGLVHLWPFLIPFLLAVLLFVKISAKRKSRRVL